MIYFKIDSAKKLALSSGASFAGEKGTVASVALPTLIEGETVADYDSGALYVKYGSDYAELAFDALTGDQEVAIPDAALATAGTITLWAEFSGDSGDVVIKTNLLSYVVGAGETYVAPEETQTEGGNGGGGEG